MPKWMDSARDFLGLGEDPYYDDYDGDADDDLYEEVAEPARPQRRRPADDDIWDDGDGGVRMLREDEAPASPVERVERPAPVASPAAAPMGSDRGVVRPLPSTNRLEVVSPTRFDDVQEVADAFKKVQPVIINLQGVDRDLSRRLIDFASGLCYGLEGEMERVADQVFLLTPRGAEVSEDDRRRLAAGELETPDS